MQCKMDFLTARIRHFETLSTARSFSSSQEPSLEQQLSDLRRQYREDLAKREATLRDHQNQAQRRDERLGRLEAENDRLLHERSLLQAEADTAAKKLRTFEELTMERKQLQEEVSNLRQQLIEAKRFAQDKETETGLLTTMMSARLDAEVYAPNG